jgi:O-antigen/teichoic acid export membrane protein
MLFDLGISNALAKHLAELDPRSEREAVSEYVSSATVAVLAGLALLSGLALVLRTMVPLPAFFQQANLGICIALFATALLANLANYALVGLHRQDLASYIGAAFVLLNAGGTAILLIYGGKVRALVLFNIAVCVATALVCTLVFRRISGATLTFRMSSSHIRRLLRTGWALQLYGLAALFYLYLGKWIIVLVISVAAVSAFEIALRVLVVLKQGFGSVASPLMAAASRLSVTSHDSAKSLLQNSFRYFTMLAVPVFTAVAVFAPKLIFLWMGPGHGDSAAVLTLLAPGFLFGTLSGVVWFVLAGAGKSSSGVKIALAEVAGGLLLCSTLTYKYGLMGAAAGLSIPGTLSILGYLYLGKKALGISIWECIFELGRALVVSATVIGSAALLVGGVESRAFIAMAVVSSTAIACGLLALLATSQHERTAALRFLRLQSAPEAA